jgi:hypothetical protein
VADCQRYNVHLVEGGDATVRDNDIIGGLQGGLALAMKIVESWGRTTSLPSVISFHLFVRITFSSYYSDDKTVTS